jgi:nucleoid DNA-binding protein
MNKRDLINKVTEMLKNNNIRKPVSTPKQVFHISDDEGNQSDFAIRKPDKKVLYNTNDVTAIIETCLSVIEDAIRHGEKVYIHGFGVFDIHKRAARQTKHPDTGEVVYVQERYVPKFSFGNNLRMAAKVYELSLDERKNNLYSEPQDAFEECDG